MIAPKRLLTLLGVAVLSLALGMVASHFLNPPSAEIVNFENMAQKRNAEFQLPDLDGQLRNAKEWRGKVLVVNFWATWCPPCRHEMPMFVAVQEAFGAKGLQFVGIAIDKPELAREFAQSINVNYPILLADSSALAKQYGNRSGGLPFTAVFGRDGQLAKIFIGQMSRDETIKAIQPLL